MKNPCCYFINKKKCIKSKIKLTFIITLSKITVKTQLIDYFMYKNCKAAYNLPPASLNSFSKDKPLPPICKKFLTDIHSFHTK